MNPKDSRILVVSEHSALSTGFSIITRNFLERLWKAGYQNIAELGSYGRREDPYMYDYSLTVPWQVYFTYPPGVNYDQFHQQDIEAQFGKLAFEDVCLEFQPDIVYTIRDPWHDCFIERSVFRKNFKWLYQICVDSDPIPASHINLYRGVDMLLTYSAYGKYVAETQVKKEVFDIAKCGVDLNVYKPQDKVKIREKYGLDPEAVIFGTVCRNQPRKRLARYFDSIRILLNHYKDIDNFYFLLHTSNPDVGPNLPEHIDRLGIGQHILFSYWCRNCNHHKISHYIGDSMVACPNCNTFNMTLPDSHKSLNDNQMADLYALMDYYVQPSIAGACLVPDSLVLTKDGYKKIQDITTNDFVLTHIGEYKQVLHTMCREYDGDIINIRSKYINQSVEVTKDHKIPVFRNNKLEWIEAQHLNSSDMLVRPIYSPNKELKYFDSSDFLNKDRLSFTDEVIFLSGKNKFGALTNRKDYTSLKRKIILDNNTLKFFGLFLAEGGITFTKTGPGYITFSLHRLEQEYVDFIKFVLSNYFGITNVRQRNRGVNGIELSVGSKLLAQLFYNLFGRDCYTKTIPQFIYDLPPHLTKHLVSGFICGDESFYNNEYSKLECVIEICNINLIQQIQNLLLRNGYYPSYYVNLKKPSYKLRLTGYQVKLLYSESGKICHNMKSEPNFYELQVGWTDEKYQYLPIAYLGKSHYKGLVYNIEVDTVKSYTTNICAISNCEMPLVEAKACGKLVLAPPCAAMAEQVTNFPTFYTERMKEIGYEYEAPNEEVLKYWDDNDLGGLPIPIKTYWWDELIEVRRHLFDVDKLADLLHTCIKNINIDWYKEFSEQARECAIKHHDWEKTAVKWMAAIDKLSESIDRTLTWDAGLQQLQVPNYGVEALASLSNAEFLDHCYRDVLKDDVKIGNSEYHKILDGLNRGRMFSRPKMGICPHCQDRPFYPGGNGAYQFMQPVTREEVWKSVVDSINQKNTWEQARVAKKNPPTITQNNGFNIMKF